MSRLVRIFDPDKHSEPMRLACFMSGSGTNIVKIIENERAERDRSYHVVLIFTDNEDQSRCNAQKIAESHKIAVVMHDMGKFYANHGQLSKRDLLLRRKYDTEVAELISPYDVDVIALGGYMSILTKPMLDRYPGRIVNVHPGDLSVKAEGRRRFVGLHAVRDAIMAGEKEIFSTTHVVREEVDNGEILMRSQPVRVVLPRGLTPKELGKTENRTILDNLVAEHQERLKAHGDWVIFPKTLQLIGEGLFALDGEGNSYLDEVIQPNGVRL